MSGAKFSRKDALVNAVTRLNHAKGSLVYTGPGTYQVIKTGPKWSIKDDLNVVLDELERLQQMGRG